MKVEMMGHIRTHDPAITTIYMSGDIGPYRPFLKEEKKNIRSGLKNHFRWNY